MSAKISGAVWDLDLPHNQMLVLLAMADHADHEGRHVRASLPLIAWKAGYEVRQVQRIVHSLEQAGLLIITAVGGGRSLPTEYAIVLKNGVKKSPFSSQPLVQLVRYEENPDILTPIPANHDKMSGFSRAENTDKMSGFCPETVTSQHTKGDICNPSPLSPPLSPPQTPPLTPPLTPHPASVTNLKTEDPSVATATSPQGETTSSWASDPEGLLTLYNALTPDDHPKVRTVTPQRRKKAQAALRLFPERDFWEQVLREIGQSSFLQGFHPSPGHESFRGDLDWLLSRGKDGTENFIKVHEGKYRDTPRSRIAPRLLKSLRDTAELLEEADDGRDSPSAFLSRTRHYG